MILLGIKSRVKQSSAGYLNYENSGHRTKYKCNMQQNSLPKKNFTLNYPQFHVIKIKTKAKSMEIPAPFHEMLRAIPRFLIPKLL